MLKDELMLNVEQQTEANVNSWFEMFKIKFVGFLENKWCWFFLSLPIDCCSNFICHHMITIRVDFSIQHSLYFVTSHVFTVHVVCALIQVYNCWHSSISLGKYSSACFRLLLPQRNSFRWNEMFAQIYTLCMDLR